jgi:hypothetical protein
MNSVKIAEELGTAVWKAHNPDAIDRVVVDDFITTSGVDIVTKNRCIPQRDYEISLQDPDLLRQQAYVGGLPKRTFLHGISLLKPT